MSSETVIKNGLFGAWGFSTEKYNKNFDVCKTPSWNYNVSDLSERQRVELRKMRYIATAVKVLGYLPKVSYFSAALHLRTAYLEAREGKNIAAAHWVARASLEAAGCSQILLAADVGVTALRYLADYVAPDHNYAGFVPA